MRISTPTTITNLPNVNQSLREVRRGVADAPDAHLLEVVRIVDALKQRGEADALLATVRERLRAIHPARPLRFSRLLFLPADPLIVAPAQWRPGSPTIPRQALMPLANCVRTIMAASCDASRDALECVDAAIEGATTADSNIVHDAGAQLWPLAATALLALAMSPDRPEARACEVEWRALGLPAGELTLMAQGLSSVLAAADPLHEAAAKALSDEHAIHLLSRANERGPRAGAMLRCLLLLRAPHVSAALLANAKPTASQRTAANDAAALALDHIERELAVAPGLVTPDALAEMHGQANLLDALSQQQGDADYRRRVGHARAAALDLALHRLDSSLQSCLLAPLRDMPCGAQASDTDVGELEAASRQLRVFEQEARRLGVSAKFDTLVATVPRALGDAASLTAMDRARLLEIFAGPKAALRSLRPTG